jgi:hypothetical protein
MSGKNHTNNGGQVRDFPKLTFRCLYLSLEF